MDCDLCELRKACRQVVWGAGHNRANLFVVGDKPGLDEDLFGEPFVSREGLLWKKKIETAGIDVGQCYFTYAVKCDGNAKAKHVAACSTHLFDEIRSVQPKVILTLGLLPAQLLLRQKSISLIDVLGEFHKVGHSNAVVATWGRRPNKASRKIPMEKTFFKRLKEKIVEATT